MDKFEAFLRFALQEKAEPDRRLNEKIMERFKEEDEMRKWNMKKAVAIAAMSVAILSASGISAYAVWNYLYPREVAEKAGDAKLAKAFESQNMAAESKTQVENGYAVTMLGVVSGKDISDRWIKNDDGQILRDRSYIVTAIAKEDGSAMQPEEAEDTIYVSPYIKGLNPAKVNIFHMDGGHLAFVENGVYYRLIDCDNLEIFAARGVYLGVSDRVLCEAEQYDFDEATGEITAKADYDGLNLLFELPMDIDKANEAAAAEKIREWEAFWTAPDTEDETGEPLSDSGDLESRAPETGDKDREHAGGAEEKWTPETILRDAVRLEDTVKTMTPDQEGYIDYSWSAFGCGGEGKSLLEWDEYEVGKTYATAIINLNGRDIRSEDHGASYETTVTDLKESEQKDLIVTCTKNEDGSVTMAVYLEK